jgi:hypothetical protein
MEKSVSKFLVSGMVSHLVNLKSFIYLTILFNVYFVSDIVLNLIKINKTWFSPSGSLTTVQELRDISP